MTRRVSSPSMSDRSIAIAHIEKVWSATDSASFTLTFETQPARLTDFSWRIE
jgi:hypothetical protein